MAGLFALSVNPKCQKDFLTDLYWGNFYGQHLGEEYGGLSSFNEARVSEKIAIKTHRGLFGPLFAEDLAGLEGTEAIGFCGLVREPYVVETKLGRISICFSGNIVNLPELVSHLKSKGDIFQRGDDIELIAKLIAQGNSIIDGIRNLNREIKGAYALLILTEEGIYAVRCPSGHWSLVLGQKEGVTVATSESIGFSNLGLELIRDLEPGEVVLLKNGQYQTKDKAPSKVIQFCSFRWVYTDFVNSVFEGIPSSLVRKRLGAPLARQDIAEGFIPDFVLPVLDSGTFHAIGYHQEFCRQVMEGKIPPNKIPLFDELLLKYPYIGRSFTRSTPAMRSLIAKMKLVPSGERYLDKKAVVNDDSLVRGVQTQENLVPKLKETGLAEIHLRISNPELRSHCRWGKTTKKGELFACRLCTIAERVKFLGVTSLKYNEIPALVEAIGLPRELLCLDCSLDVPD